MNLLILIAVHVLSAWPAHAAKETRAPKPAPAERSGFICEEVMTNTPKGPIVVRHDGRSKAYGEAGLQDALDAQEALHKLGVPTPPHQIIFAPERQLNILAATGLLPAPHAISGAAIYEALRTGSSMGVLEFAQPGGQPAGFSGSCSTCRSYYSNTTRLRDQRPIYLHVGGHNHVFQRSRFSLARNVDPIAASAVLAETMEALYAKHGYEPVALYYHYLAGVQWLQDNVGGTFEDPSRLSQQASKASDVDVQSDLGNWSFLGEKQVHKVVPWESSASILQWMVSNQPSHVPEYKRELLEKFEMTVRPYPAVGVQKFVHEGWATFLMMLGQKHSKWNTDRDVFDFARLVSAAVSSKINVNHPYTFGVMGYYHLYQKFMRSPEVQGLTPLAADIEFVKHVDSLLPTMTDLDFVHRVIDDEFVTRHKLAMIREGTQQEMSEIWRRLQAKGVPEDQWPRHLIISKSAERLRRALVRNQIRRVPQLKVINPELANPFQVNLEQQIFENLPLEPESAAQVLFAVTQVMELPVVAEILLSERHITGRTNQLPEAVRVKLEVRPDGRVRVFKGEDSLVELASRLEQAVTMYRTDQSFSFSDRLTEDDQKRWQQMFPKLVEDEVAKANVAPLAGLVDYAPAAGRAIMLFSQLIRARFAKKMEAAMQGRLKLVFGPNGVKLPLIPRVPSLSYDREHMQAHQQVAPPAPMDTLGFRVNAALAAEDDNTLIGPAGGSVGDPIRLPGQGGGQGKGNGDQDDGSDSNSITIPSELYRKILAMHFEIPNPRRTDGETEMETRLPMGRRRDASEAPIWEDMVADALTKAIVQRRAKGEAEPMATTSYAELIREGFGLLDEDDYIIRSQRPVNIPSFDAVVVVNVDLSGSMSRHRVDLVKNVVFNIRELFRYTYPNVKFHYVGLSDDAEEYPENKIWTVYKGGGSQYRPALDLTVKILNNYPYEQYNQYVFFAGDSELGDLDTFMAGFDQARNLWQYFGLIVTRDPNDPQGIDSGNLRSTLGGYLSKWKWIGITQVNTQEDIFRGLSDLFSKPAKDAAPL